MDTLKSPTIAPTFAPVQPSVQPYGFTAPGTRLHLHPLKGVVQMQTCVGRPPPVQDGAREHAGLRLVEEEDGLIDESDPWYLLIAAAVDLAVRQVAEAKRLQNG